MKDGRPQFKIVLRGYERNEVDSVVDKVLSGLPMDMNPQQDFTIVLRGYDRAEVDQFLQLHRG